MDDVIAGAVAMFKNENIVMRLNEKKKRKVPAMPTGLAPLDLALGIGGIPKGRIIEVFGPESSGKTTLICHMIAKAQRDEKAWAWIGDMEHAIDPEWLEKIGVNMDKLLISQPDSGEECLDLCEYMVSTGVIDIAVVDSVAALVPRKELEGESGEAVIGLQARLMSQAMRKLTSKVSRKGCNVFFTNQIREKIGVTWGSPETTSGGRALKFFASIRIDIRKTANEKEGEDNVVGSIHKLKIVKNKVAPPFKICELMLDYDRGFDMVANLFYPAVDKGIIEKKGNTFSLGDIVLGVGQKKAIKGLRELGTDKINEIYKEVIGKVVKIEKGEFEEVKDKIAKLEKKLLETEDEEAKKKLEIRIDKLKNGDVSDEDKEEAVA